MFTSQIDHTLKLKNKTPREKTNTNRVLKNSYQKHSLRELNRKKYFLKKLNTKIHFLENELFGITLVVAVVGYQ
jgi:hypothetical protein